VSSPSIKPRSSALLLPVLLPVLMTATLAGCGQTGPLYLPAEPVDETVTEIDVTEGDASDEVGVGAETGLEAGIQAGREGGLEDGMEGPAAGPVEGAEVIDDEVLIESGDAP